ncbi:hypothetical protein [Candidatus Ichthyocystis sparus]|uniref:hypothetical protein n=1 Tax=Candidatus Ichthyocystis sparus TaxID=1561004 RepID=UPI00159EE5C2|nr:hypothetical protein [Candidatus Ichthyocystis sparus]
MSYVDLYDLLSFFHLSCSFTVFFDVYSRVLHFSGRVGICVVRGVSSMRHVFCRS